MKTIDRYTDIIDCLDMKIDAAIDGQLGERLTGRERKLIKARKKEKAWGRLLDHLTAVACPPTTWAL